MCLNVLKYYLKIISIINLNKKYLLCKVCIRSLENMFLYLDIPTLEQGRLVIMRL